VAAALERDGLITVADGMAGLPDESSGDRGAHL
jgi:hypothetical protein